MSRDGSAMRNAEHPLTQVSKPASKLNKNENKRIKLLLAMTTESTSKKACAQAGVSLMAPSRIDKRRRETGSILDRPHPGRQPIYTPEVFQRANKVAADLPPRMRTTGKVLQALVREQVVHEGANTQAFRRAWKKYNRAHGTNMNMKDTSTTFSISASDSNSRLRFAARMLQLLNSREPPDVNFFDETTVELSPHPKSSACRQRYMCMQHCICFTHTCMAALSVNANDTEC